MKNKLLTLLLLVGLLISTYGTAFAQGPLPPQGSQWLSPDPNHKVEIKKVPRIGPMRSPSSAPVVSAVTINPLVVVGTQVVNGNFEQGSVGWTQSSALGTTIVRSSHPQGTTTVSGSWLAWFNATYGNNENATLAQSNITISAPTHLRLSYWTASDDDCGFDAGYLKINSDIIYTWDLCVPNNTFGWRTLDLDLAAYDGQTVNLTIQVITDVSLGSGMLVDDISFYKTFPDVPVGYWSEDFIHRLFNNGVTAGCGGSPLMYCPGTTVTRDQMAVFLLRGIHGSSYSPPDVAGSTGFVDVAPTYWAAAWIKELAAEGITGGCGDGKYCPGSPVTRDQMAIFLLRAEHGLSYVPPAVTGVFTDVAPTYWAAAWIEALASEGITSGCTVTPKQYCPGRAVTRDQMAVFLVRTFALP